jgi:hypothetical protein
MIIKNKKINPIDCSEAAKRLNDYLDDYLIGKAKEELVHHIESCRHCFERVEFEKMLKGKISSIGKKQSSKKRDLNFLEKILSIPGTRNA